MELETEDGRRIENASWPEVEELLSAINPHEGRGYFILTGSDGSYLQTAGAKLRMIVEQRVMRKEGDFRHYVVGESGCDTALTSINSSVGIIQLQRNEILPLRVVLGIFKSFLETETVPNDLTLRDDTERFRSDR